jgi:hypothetical protein
MIPKGNRKGFEMSFGWLFAVIVGAVVIFFAIYFASNLIQSQKDYGNSKSAKQFDILLYPAGTGLEENKLDTIIFPIDTLVTLGCNPAGNFGEQIITTLSSSTISSNNIQRPKPTTSKDKYLFGKENFNAKTVLVFSKSWKFPFKVADLVYLIDSKERYCFIQTPTNIKKEIERMRQENSIANSSFILADNEKDCKSVTSTKVCFYFSAGSSFSNSECDYNVNPEIGKIWKGSDVVYYDPQAQDNALFFAAIFSEPHYYECQLKRMMKRTSALSSVYYEKTVSLGEFSCGSGVAPLFLEYSNITKSLNNSYYITQIYDMSNDIGRRNEKLLCPIF